jgi:hypothetical protein
MKTKQRLMSAAMVAAGTMLCRVLFAADVAFYPFNEGNDGDNAVGATIQNAANPGTLSGTASQVKADTTATATFLDDVPGRYLYTNATWSADAIYRSDVFRSIQTSWVTNSWATIISATSIDFADLGARLSELDAFTVEYFFKFDAFLKVKGGAYHQYQSNVLFGDDEKLIMCLQNKLEPTFVAVRTHCGGVTRDASSGTLTWSSEPGKEIYPGIWHHVATTYDRATRKFNTTLDYTHVGTAKACTNEVAFTTGPFKLGNGVSAIRFAALRITDRVLSADELMRASSVSPTGLSLTGDFETRFHWSFESKTPGDSLGMVRNDAHWYKLVEQDYACQYPYAVDGQSFIFSGNGIVTPLTFNYTSLGTLTMGGYASNVTDRARSSLEYPNGNLRTNNVCAFVEAGPKNDPNNKGEVFGKGPTFRMTDTNLLTSADFTAETYWMPDREGWLAKLGNDAGGRYRASIFGVKGNMRDDVPNRITCSYVWCLHFNMNTENFNIGCIVRKPDGTYLDDNKWTIMGNAYSAKCKDGLMHHYAVVYRVSDANNGGKPTVRLYIDREEGYKFGLAGPIVNFESYFKNAAFALGAQELNNHPMQGWFDEVRYTARALAPAEFLTLRRPPKGLRFIIR